MKLGQQVTYQDAHGKRSPATITAVPGTGASGSKTLNLTLENGRARTDIPHEKDAKPGGECWTELVAESAAEKPAKPKRRIKRK